VTVKRMTPSRLIALLLGLLLFALLGWWVLRIDPGSPPVQQRRVTRPVVRTPRKAPKVAVERPRNVGTEEMTAGPTGLLLPVADVDPRSLRDNFVEMRGKTRAHDALDIPAPRGTRVLAVADGFVKKLFKSVPGGLTVYHFDRQERYCYYYAHLDGYAPGLQEGQSLRRGDLVGFVGTTGNAPADSPHLHFAVHLLGPDKRWWAGTPVNPYPLLVKAP
jgi:murein DD-endopeptidase MepM/ murein hydrolase activator NlpD